MFEVQNGSVPKHTLTSKIFLEGGICPGLCPRKKFPGWRSKFFQGFLVLWKGGVKIFRKNSQLFQNVHLFGPKTTFFRTFTKFWRMFWVPPDILQNLEPKLFLRTFEKIIIKNPNVPSPLSDTVVWNLIFKIILKELNYP